MAFSLSLGFALQNFTVKTTARSAVFGPEAECVRCFVYRALAEFYSWDMPPACLRLLLLLPTWGSGWDHYALTGIDGGLIVRQRVVFSDCTLTLPGKRFLPFDGVFPNPAPAHRANTGKSDTHKCSLRLFGGDRNLGHTRGHPSTKNRTWDLRLAVPPLFTPKPVLHPEDFSRRAQKGVTCHMSPWGTPPGAWYRHRRCCRLEKLQVKLRAAKFFRHPCSNLKSIGK